MAKGVVKWFNSRKGYGFITLESGDEVSDVFVHYSAIKVDDESQFRSLYEGDVVEFTIVEGSKGSEARDVIILEKAARPHRWNEPISFMIFLFLIFAPKRWKERKEKKERKKATKTSWYA